MKRYTLENHEIQIEFLAMGGCITKIINKKTKTNYVLSYDDLWHYCTNPYFFGAIIGRNAGRTFPAYYLSHKKDSILLDKNEKVIIYMEEPLDFILESFEFSRRILRPMNLD